MSNFTLTGEDTYLTSFMGNLNKDSIVLQNFEAIENFETKGDLYAYKNTG